MGSKVKTMRVAWLLLLSVLTVVTGQAPGDENEQCTVTFPRAGQNIVEDPPNSRILMDSSHYFRLLPPFGNPVWQDLDLDSNNNAVQTTDWVEQGEQCSSLVTVCGYDAGPQNNWLITQHINRTVDGVPLQQVTVQIEYQQTTCPETGSNVCRRIFELLKYETSTIDPAAAVVTTNYDLIATLTTQVGLETETALQSFNFDTNESGLYLAVRDPGTCILISRLIVFYYTCPADVVGLVQRPETIAPPVGSSQQITITPSCVDNASPMSEDFTSNCLERGIWSNTLSCACNSGFIQMGNSCISCGPGFYASVANGVCLVCPANSNSTQSGLVECPCDNGFYRTPQEVDLPCTQPPSPPLNIMIVNTSPTTITLSWEEPESTGGRNRSELRYNLWYREAGVSEIILATEDIEDTMGVIRGLQPETSYQVFVTSETGITNQIPMTSEFILARGGMQSIELQVVDPGVVAGAVVGVVVLIIVLLVIVLLLVYCVWRQKRIVKKTIDNYAAENTIQLPKIGRRMYVDPTTYASPNDAVRDFTSEIPPKTLQLKEEIGSGEFGNVYKGIWKNEGKQIPMAVKTLKPGSSNKMKNDFLQEAAIMGQFNHANVIKLYGVVTKVEPVMIVMEYMDNGSLYHYLRKHDDRLSILRQVKMARNVAAGMDYLSTVGFVHRDLAARNVLVTKDEICKVADFGLSRETVDDEYDVKKGGKIPVRWTAPEAIFQRRFTSASDVWSYGVLLWEVMSYGQHPYEVEDWDNQTVLDKLEMGYRLQNPHGCPQTVYNLMLNCWHAEKNERPTFAQIVTHLDQLIEKNMEANVPEPAVAPKVVPKTYLSSAHILDPLDYTSVNEWLAAIKMERYKELFQSAGYTDINQVLYLTEADLKTMGITLAGHLYRFTSSIEKGQSHLTRQASITL